MPMYIYVDQRGETLVARFRARQIRAVAGQELTPVGAEDPSGDAVAHLPHEPLVERQVVQRQQPIGEQLARAEEVAQVRA